MHRLTAMDAALLHGETAEWHLHVTSLLELDPVTIPGGYRFEDFRDALVARLRSVPRFRQKVVPAPLGLDAPVWVDAGDFDPGRHVHPITLPESAGRAELLDLAGRLSGLKLDRRRPLWECWVIEGGGGAGLFLLIKNHHVLFDGVGGLEAMRALFDTTADGPARPPTAAPATDDPDPGPATLLLHALGRAVSTQPLAATRATAQIARKLPPLVAQLGRGGLPVTGLDAPANPFGGRITPERTFAAVSLPMSRIKDVRAATGVKVNDVLLALVGGALRRYLDRRATRPEASLVANVAMSTRSGDDGADAGNKIGVLFARLGTHLDDPAERLRCVAADTVEAKAINQRLGQGGDIDMAALGPPVVISALARLYAGIGLQDYLKVLGNVGVSNVPGPPVKLFVCGTGLRGIFVMGPLMLNSLINFTAVSYRGQLDVGIVSSPSIVAQPSELAADLTSALDELWRATGRGA